MNEKLVCGCINKGCHICGADEITATLGYENADGGTCCIHLCSECDDDLIRNKLSDKAREELGWIDDLEV
jgi:hypothetical protein